MPLLLHPRFRQGGRSVSSRDATPKISLQGSVEEVDVRGTFEDWELQEMGRSKYDELVESFVVGDIISKKAAAYRAFIWRPNPRVLGERRRRMI